MSNRTEEYRVRNSDSAFTVTIEGIGPTMSIGAQATHAKAGGGQSRCQANGPKQVPKAGAMHSKIRYALEDSLGACNSKLLDRKMKIVSWNCNGALRKKHDVIDRLEPDLLIVQECEDPERSTKAYQSWAGNYLWRGDDKNKGIGVFARSELPLTRLKWQDDGLQLFLP